MADLRTLSTLTYYVWSVHKGALWILSMVSQQRKPENNETLYLCIFIDHIWQGASSSRGQTVPVLTLPKNIHNYQQERYLWRGIDSTLLTLIDRILLIILLRVKIRSWSVRRLPGPSWCSSLTSKWRCAPWSGSRSKTPSRSGRPPSRWTGFTFQLGSNLVLAELLAL